MKKDTKAKNNKQNCNHSS